MSGVRNVEAGSSARRRDAGAPMGVGQWPAPAAMWSSSTLGRPPRTPIEMWVSLFPFAPLFGLRWFWFGMTPLSGDRDLLEAPARPKRSSAERAKIENEKLSMAHAMPEPAPAAPAPVEPPIATPIETRPAPPAPQTVSPVASNAAPAAAAPSEAASLSTPVVAPPATPASPSIRPVLSALPTRATTEGVREPTGLLAARPDRVDDLKEIHGIGPRLEQLLNELGVYTYEQIAALTAEELRWLDERLFVIKGRAERDGWVEGAKRAIAARDGRI